MKKKKMHAHRLSVWKDIERCTFARTLVKFGILAAAKNTTTSPAVRAEEEEKQNF